jgi:hypothetical protein
MAAGVADEPIAIATAAATGRHFGPSLIAGIVVPVFARVYEHSPPAHARPDVAHLPALTGTQTIAE